MGAGIAAREGRREDALLMYGEAIRQWAELQVLFDGSLVGIEMALTLGIDEPAVQAALEKSRAALDGLGAKPFVALAVRLSPQGISASSAFGSDDLGSVPVTAEVEAKAS